MPAAAAAEAPAPAKLAGKRKPAAAKSSALKPVAPQRLVTTITALIDVGYGNALFLRGEGPGLSWDQGVPLTCVEGGKWSVSLPESSHPVVCKFLLNDQEYNLGDNYTVAPGTSITITPVFGPA